MTHNQGQRKPNDFSRAVRFFFNTSRKLFLLPTLISNKFVVYSIRLGKPYPFRVPHHLSFPSCPPDGLFDALPISSGGMAGGCCSASLAWDQNEGSLGNWALVLHPSGCSLCSLYLSSCDKVNKQNRTPASAYQEIFHDVIS